MRALLVATWGYFWNWKEQEYGVNCGGSPSRIKGKSTIGASLEALRCRGASQVGGVILVPSSSLPPGAAESLVKCGEECSSLLDSLWREALSAARRLAQDSGYKGPLQAVLAPSSGTFKLGASGSGLVLEAREESGLDPADSYRGLSLLRAALSLAVDHHDVVALDSTHGINYYIVAAATALPIAAEASAALYLSDVTYLVLNSDPVIPLGVDTAWIRVAEERLFDGSEALMGSAIRVKRVYTGREGDRDSIVKPVNIVKAGKEAAAVTKKELSGAIMEAAPSRKGNYEQRYALPAVASTLYSLPLAALQIAALYAEELLGRAVRGFQDIDEAHQLHRKYMVGVLEAVNRVVDPLVNQGAYRVEKDNGVVRLRNLVAVNPVNLEAWLRANSVLGGTLKILSSALRRHPKEVTVARVDGVTVVEASIEALEEVTREHLKSPNSIATLQELSRIKSGRSELSLGEHQSSCSPDLRNFAAHAGLERRVTELEDRSGLLVARYRPCFIRGEGDLSLQEALKRLLAM